MKKTARLLLFGQTSPPWATGMSLWGDYRTGAGNMPAITDTHAATIYAQNTAGVYSPFAANVLTRTDRGVQTVPTRTNLVLQSSTYSDAAWTKTACTTTSGQASPDGGTSAWLITDTSTAAAMNTTSAITVSSATVYTLSLIVKRGNTDWIRASVFDGTVTNGHRVWFNLNTGAVGSNVAVGTGYGYSTSRVTSLGNSWYQCEIVVTAPTTSAMIHVRTAAADADTNTVTNGTYVLWNIDLTAGAFAVPPIFTAGASATVNGNSQVISGLTSQFTNGVALIAQLRNLQPGVSGDFSLAFSVTKGAVNASTDGVRVYRNQTGAYFNDNYAATVLQASGIIGPNVTAGQLITIAAMFSATYTRATIIESGSASTAVTSATYPSGLDRINIEMEGAGGSKGYGVMRKLAIAQNLSWDASGWAALVANATLASAS